MKIAIVGKGGVGKTTLSAAFAMRLADLGRPVVAVDADPDGNLASAVGVDPDRIPVPISEMRDLILERTEAKDSGAGLFFKLNPKVDDLPEKFAVDVNGLKLLVMGTVDSGGKGCMCPEATILKALMQHLLLRVPDDVVLDMEAGIEHLGRASATGVDAMIAVVEPGMRSVQTAKRVEALAADIGLSKVYVVMNKIANETQRATVEKALEGRRVIGALPYSQALADADLAGGAVDLSDENFVQALDSIRAAIESQLDA